MTPVELCETLYHHFAPQGVILEPCRGSGNFYNIFNQEKEWCEITEGKDFFRYHKKVDSIMTNPPWSQIRAFLNHSMEIADDIYFLITVNHLWTKARLRDILSKGFGIKEICVFDTPKNFPQSGFQVGMVHIKKNYTGDILGIYILDTFAGHKNKKGGGIVYG
jgi:hypothetical protein